MEKVKLFSLSLQKMPLISSRIVPQRLTSIIR